MCQPSLPLVDCHNPPPPHLSSLNCSSADPLWISNGLHYIIYGLQRHKNCIFLISPRFNSPNVLKSYTFSATRKQLYRSMFWILYPTKYPDRAFFVLCFQGANASQLEKEIGSDQFPTNEHYFGLVNVRIFEFKSACTYQANFYTK